MVNEPITSRPSTGLRPVPLTTDHRPSAALVLPLFFTTALFALGSTSSVRQNPRLLWSFLGTAIFLLAWNGMLLARALHARRVLSLELVPRKQHYIQACAH